MQLSKKQIAKGRSNFQLALGVNRRDFLRASVAVPAVGGFYFGYSKLQGAPVKAGIVGTGNEGCLAMIDQSQPAQKVRCRRRSVKPRKIGMYQDPPEESSR